MRNKVLTFEEWYELLENYYNEYGNINIKQKFKTFDGIHYDPNGYALGMWLCKIRLLDNLDDDKRNKLINMGLIFGKKNERTKLSWDEWYNLAKIYYLENGNLEIPSDYITKEGYKLGMWLVNQRKRKDNLTSEQYNKLLKIGMRFDINKQDYEWEKNYQIAKKYYVKHGNLDISSTYITEDGYKLGAWVAKQRYNKDKLPEYKIEKLLLIGMNFDNQKSALSWDEWYDLAKKYYKQYGNLKISYKFITKDGINYDKDGYKLGTWISDQRVMYNKLSPEKIKLLNSIGMIWNTRTNKTDLIELLSIYNVNINRNKKIFYKSYSEVYVKICFLKDLRKPLTNSKGILNEIFYMSDINLKSIYNIDLSYLINTYLSNNKKIKKGE